MDCWSKDQRQLHTSALANLGSKHKRNMVLLEKGCRYRGRCTLEASECKSAEVEVQKVSCPVAVAVAQCLCIEMHSCIAAQMC